MLLRKSGQNPEATHQCCSFSSRGLLGSCVEDRVADDHDGIKYVFHSLSPLLTFGITEWERWHFMVALWPRGHRSCPFRKAKWMGRHILLSSEAYSREYGAKWLRRKGSDLASVICQLVESDDTLRTIFFGIMSSLQPLYNHTVSLCTSAHLPGSPPSTTTGWTTHPPRLCCCLPQNYLEFLCHWHRECQEQKSSNSTDWYS